MAENDLTVTANLSNLIALNPATPLSPATLQLAARGRVVAVSGCVTRLM